MTLSDDLHIAVEFPFGDGLAELPFFPFARRRIVIDEGVAEQVARRLGALQPAGRFHQRARQLPRTLMEAAGRLKASKPARDLFGDAFVDHYSATREWEEREFRKAITDWELDRYMEII